MFSNPTLLQTVNNNYNIVNFKHAYFSSWLPYEQCGHTCIERGHSGDIHVRNNEKIKDQEREEGSKQIGGCRDGG